MTAAQLTAFICYRDPDAMVAWICDVLGFTVVRDYQYDEQLVHAEVRRGDAVLCVQRDDRGYEVPEPKGNCVGSGLYLVVHADDVTAIHTRAVARGTTVLIEPETTPWGNYRVELLDQEGRQWSIGSYLPGLPD